MMTALVRLVAMCFKHARTSADFVQMFGRWMDVVREVVRAPNGMAALAPVMRYILEVNEQVRPEALQALLEREIGPETKDTIVTAGQELIEQGRKQGIEQGIARSFVDVYEARFGAMPEAIRAVIEATHDEPTLRAWLKLAGTRGADEIAAAIHAVRAS